MRQDEPRERTPRSEAVSEIIQEVGDELTAAVAVPGELTYRTLDKFFTFVGGATSLLGRALGYVLRASIDVRETFNQMSAIGVASLPIVLVTVTFSGMVLALYSAQTLVTYGFAGTLVGGGIGLSIAREIGPVLTAVVVAARAGSAMAAEIGSMKVTEQVDALRALAVDPVQYLVVPRLVAAVIMLPVITVLADVVGTAGGYFVAVINGVPGGGFISSLQSFVEISDIINGLLKTLFFGATIAIVGCFEGLETRGGATGVGQSTTRAVVLSIVLIYILNFFLAYLLFGGRESV
ncbi:MAG TPA: ABC transporter permease [Armatimonadota bacterium]|nr:ABC transporter permease [Armatimonadota bacterium]